MGYGDGGYGDGGYGDGLASAPDQSYVPPVIDHVALGLSRVAKQYLGSKKFLAYLTAQLLIGNEIEAALQQLLFLPDFTTMLGVNLDMDGAIVGQTRYLKNTILLPFFGFSDDAGAGTFGEEGFPSIGARFYEEGENPFATSVLSDLDYRLLIQSRIIRNNSKATPEDILNALSFLFATNVVNIDDNGGMAIQLAVGVELTAIQKIIIEQLDILPRPTGVKITGLVSYNSSAYFGFADQPNALPFSEETAPNGAFLAEEIVY